MLQKRKIEEISNEHKNSLYKFYNDGKFELVIENLKSLMKEFPNSTFLFNLAGSSNLALKKYEIRDDPSHPE